MIGTWKRRLHLQALLSYFGKKCLEMAAARANGRRPRTFENHIFQM
jgi:hypothetical protein